MRVLLAKEYVDKFYLKEISKRIYKKFDEYNYKVFLAKNYYGKTTSTIKEVAISNSFSISNPTQQTTIKREELLNEIKKFSIKIKNFKSTLTEDEKAVFKYGIEQRLTDNEIADAIAKSLKTTRQIKRSCYVKVALHFNLIKKDDKAVYKCKKTISSMN